MDQALYFGVQGPAFFINLSNYFLKESFDGKMWHTILESNGLVS